MEQASLTASRVDPDTVCVRVAGVWRLRRGLPPADAVAGVLDERVRRLVFDARDLAGWDSSLVTVLAQVLDGCRGRLEVERTGLPAGVQRLLALVEAVPEKQGARGGATRPAFLVRVGTAAIEATEQTRQFLAFLGEATRSFARFLRRHARYRRVDLVLEVQEAGARALPIVTLISFLVGLIMAFVGAVSLQQFGAGIYVANMVAVAMAREMGAMMTAIIMAGRTGSAYAAQLGTMNVSQEIDALTTMGIPPIDFLVLPRMLALSLMMPLLAIYADFIGILGGVVVGTTMLDLSATQYWEQTKGAITVADFTTGVGKSVVFGVLVALAGCMEGMRAGRSASAVGDAATRAAVRAIVYVIVADGIFAVVFHVLGI
ncbi:MAG: ABC transporter permease [Deltaproteobacteria bacterium]|nr:MAG: ABC transporter permease [Deltaproteobacteria bacterium]